MKNFLNNMVLAIVLLTSLSLAGCAPTNYAENSATNSYNWWCKINNTSMIYDKSTLVIYYRDYYGDHGYMAPYYNEDGQLCRYVDGQIVPIE